MVLWAAYSVVEPKGALEQLTQNHLLSRGGARGSEILDASPTLHQNLTYLLCSGCCFQTSVLPIQRDCF